MARTRVKDWSPMAYIHSAELAPEILKLLSETPQSESEVCRKYKSATLIAVKKALALLSSKGLAHRYGGGYSNYFKRLDDDEALRQQRYTERFIISPRGVEFLRRGGRLA